MSIGNVIYKNVTDDIKMINDLCQNSESVKNLLRTGLSFLGLYEVSVKADSSFIKNLPKEAADFLLSLPKHFQHYVPCWDNLPDVKSIKVVITPVKDFLTVLEFVERIKVMLTDFWKPERSYETGEGVDEFWNWKKGTQFFQFSQSIVECLFLIPGSWNWVDLGKTCATLGSWTGLTVTQAGLFGLKDVFVVAASSSNVMYANSVENEKIEAIAKYEARREDLKGLENQVTQLLEEIIHNNPLQIEINERLKQVEIARQTYRAHRAAEMHGGNRETWEKVKELKFADKVAGDTKRLESKIAALDNSTEKLSDAETDALHAAKNELRALQEKKARKNLFAEAANGHNKTTNELVRYLQKMQNVVAYKRLKFGDEIKIAEKDKEKACVGRAFDISKIFICLLSLTVTTGLTVTYLASAAGAIAVATPIFGIVVGILGAYKTWNMYNYNKQIQVIRAAMLKNQTQLTFI